MKLVFVLMIFKPIEYINRMKCLFVFHKSVLLTQTKHFPRKIALSLVSKFCILNKHLLFSIFLLLPFISFAQSQIKDSIEVVIAPEYSQVGKTHRFLFGENYRKAWATPVKVRVFDLRKAQGGLEIVKLGGGMQTKSLRLRDKSGREYVLRTLQKFPERALPQNLKNTIAKDILQDQVSTSNPFAALTVPPLADALQIPHSNPEVVYVADDPGLGEYRKEFANQVFLFEERIPDESDKTDNSLKVIKKLRDDNDVLVDQKIVLRARLLDMLLGDWDRHEDQWRWDKIKEGKTTRYTPIPRDRDQVFYQTSGVFPWIVSHQWLKSKFQPYEAEIRDINGWNFNARYFDRTFLNQLNEADWETEIAYVQGALTDDKIASAIKKLPPSIWKLDGERLTKTFISRRDNLRKQALAYYRFISIFVEIPMSDKHERFSIDYKSGGIIDVKINKTLKDGEVQQQLYTRSFDPEVTKEIRLYGFDGQDAFHVTGDQKSSIKVRLIGGGDVDTFALSNNFTNKKNLYIYDRSDKKNVVENGTKAKLRLSADTAVNEYDRNSFVYDRFMPVIMGEYNNDYGVSLILGFADTKQGFRKKPYAFHHEFLVKYSTVRQSFLISYEADWKKAIGNNDLSINLLSHGPNNYSNFFGIGNNTKFRETDNGISHFRNRYDYINGDVSLSHTYGRFKLKAGLAGQFYNSSLSNNEQRFLAEYNLENPDAFVFGTRWYSGITVGAKVDTRNNSLQPTNGVHWQATFNALQNLNVGKQRYADFNTDFSFYLNPGQDSVFVIANRTGFGTNFGQPEYYQMMKLGGPQTLRGYHTWRFTGRTMAYNNFEVRLKVLDFNSYLFPGKLGVIGFHDIGRVWSPETSSSNWHNGYGGGIYFSPADLILLQGVVGFSKESTLTYISLGFRF